jgi:deoxyribodipyrimidine photolyase-related protein
MNTVWILGDQLSPEHAALGLATPQDSHVLIVESKARGSVLRYHQIKLVLVYSAMRHFARDLREKGWQVDYYQLEQGLTFESALREHVRKHHPAKVVLAEPNSFFETDAIAKLGRKLRIEIEFITTNQFLVARDDFRAWASGQKRLVMENHYRRMRKRFGWLMQPDGQPEGGAWNFDPKNRATFSAWRRAGAPKAKTLLKEEPDAVRVSQQSWAGWGHMAAGRPQSRAEVAALIHH